MAYKANSQTNRKDNKEYSAEDGYIVLNVRNTELPIA